MQALPKSHRRRRLSAPFVLAILAATLLSPTVLLAMTYLQALQSAETMMKQRVDGATRRTSRLVSRAESELNRFLTESQDLPAADLPLRLTRLVYTNPSFREAGIIDGKGRLIFTNFGPVVPPQPVPANERSDPARPVLQVIGLVRTVVMQDQSIVIALPTADGGEVNVLVDPQVLTAYLFDLDLGPSGFFAFTLPDGRILASIGDPPIDNNRLDPTKADDLIRADGVSRQRHIHVVGAISRDWVLRDWERNVWIIAGIALACNALLAFVLYRLLQRSTGLDHDIRIGLSKREFSLVYQPIVDLLSGRPAGFEALLRWQHPVHGAISPSLFIPLAEETGQIRPLTDWLLRTVAAELSDVLQTHPGLWVGVNAPMALLEDGAIVHMLTSALDGSGLPPDRVRLEITERHLYEDDQGVIRATMIDLRRRGVLVGLDDFGAGSCGLSHLMSLDLAYLKIDKSFVREIGQDDDRGTIILGALIDIGRRLNIRIVGEGIETREQESYLRSAYVHFGQGWLFATPMPAADLGAYLAKGA